MKTTWRIAIALMAFTLIAAACGDDDAEEPAAPGARR